MSSWSLLNRVVSFIFAFATCTAREIFCDLALAMDAADKAACLSMPLATRSLDASRARFVSSRAARLVAMSSFAALAKPSLRSDSSDFERISILPCRSGVLPRGVWGFAPGSRAGDTPDEARRVTTGGPLVDDELGRLVDGVADCDRRAVGACGSDDRYGGLLGEPTLDLPGVGARVPAELVRLRRGSDDDRFGVPVFPEIEAPA